MANPKFQFIFADPSQFSALGQPGVPFQACTPNLKMLDDGGEVSFSGSVPPNPDGSFPSDKCQIKVGKGKKPKLHFTVVDHQGSPTAYYLAGLALQQESIQAMKKMWADASLRPGGPTFPEMKVTTDPHTGATTLTLDNQNNGQSGKTIDYKFWVLAQDSTGAIGLIDPKITNTN